MKALGPQRSPPRQTSSAGDSPTGTSVRSSSRTGLSGGTCFRRSPSEFARPSKRVRPVSAGPAHCPSEREVLIAAALATMLLPLNSTMVAVALPDLVDDLGSTLAASTWLISGYLIAQAALQPLSGKLGDRFGRRPLILYGLASFGVASL